MTGLAIVACEAESVHHRLNRGLEDSAVSVRIAAADGLFRMGRYEEGLPTLIDALEHPLEIARTRAANVLNMQSPAVAEKLLPALAPLKRAITKFEKKGVDWQFWYPMERAVKLIEGTENYYRWDD